MNKRIFTTSLMS